MSDTYAIRITATDTASPVFRSIAGEANKTKSALSNVDAKGLRTIGTEAQRAETVLESLGKEAVAALQKIEQNSGEAAASIKEFGTATKQAEASSKGFGDSLTKIGAGAGALVAGLSLVGQASVSQQQSIASLERSYGSAADEILNFTEQIQDSTRFSNDEARSAASLAATLANSYGLSTQQIETLLTRTADLAQQFGISFEDAALRTTSAIRGEAESAELLNLSLGQSVVGAYAASQGITNYSTGLDQAGQAQVRYNLFLEQSATAQGAAGEAAETAAGQASQLQNSIQDGAAALGDFLGPAAQMASVLAPTALALPLIGAGFGQVATAARTAGAAAAATRIGGLALGAALGPVGLAAAAVAGGLALLDLIGVFDDSAAASVGAASGVADVTTQLYALQDAGVSDAIVVQAQNINTAWHQAESALRSYNDTHAAQIAEQEDPLRDQLIQPDVIRTAGASEAIQAEIDQLYILGDEVDAANADVLAIVSRLGDANINGGQLGSDLNELIGEFQNGTITASQFIVILDAMANSIDENYRILPAAAAGVDLLTYSLLDGNDASQEFKDQLERINEAAARFGTSNIAGIRSYITQLEEVRRLQLQAGNTTGATETTAIIGEANAELQRLTDARVDIVQGGVAAVRDARAEEVAAEREANAALFKTFDDRKQQAADARAEAAEEARKARADSAASVAESYRSALGQTSDAPLLDGLDDMVATKEISQEAADAIRGAFAGMAASGASTLEIIRGLSSSSLVLAEDGTLVQRSFYETSGSVLDFSVNLDKAVSGTNGVLGLYDAIDNLSGVLEKAAGIANDLFGEGGDAFDGVGPLVDMLNDGTISQQQFNDAVAAGTQIQADNTRGQESLNAVRANLLPLLADQTEQLANYYEELANGSDIEQQRALYLSDTANQQKVLNLEQAAYAASIGEIPPEVVTTLIADAANADPILKQTLSDMGLISVGADGTITVNFPDGESMTATITTLNDTLETLTSTLAEIAGLDDPFADKAAGAAAAKLNTDALTTSTLAYWASLRGEGGPGIGGVVGMFGGGPGSGRPGDGIDGYDPVVPYQETPHSNPTPPGAFPGSGPDVATPPFPGYGPSANQTVTIDYVANTAEAVASVGALEVVTIGLTTGAHYVVVDSDVTQAGADLAGVEGQVRVLDESGATVYLGADDAQALQAMAGVDGQIRVLDEATGTVYVYGDATDAAAAMAGIDAAHKALDGTTATLFQLGDNSDAIGAIGEAAASLAGVDGTNANVTVSGLDNYSGTINGAKGYDGVVLATTYVDTYHRDFFETFAKGNANGGVVGYADGGVLQTAAMSRVLVGENGPELATLPGGTLITPSPASQQIAERMRGDEGGVTNYNFYGTVLSAQDIMRMFSDGLSMGMRRSVNAYAGTGAT